MMMMDARFSCSVLTVRTTQKAGAGHPLLVLVLALVLLRSEPLYFFQPNPTQLIPTQTHLEAGAKAEAEATRAATIRVCFIMMAAKGNGTERNGTKRNETKRRLDGKVE